MLEYPIIGFNPDLPADLQGNIVASSAIVPTLAGVASTTIRPATLTATVTGAPVTAYTYDPGLGLAIGGLPTARPRNLITASSQTIYALSSGALTSVGSGATSGVWSFAQMGRIIVAGHSSLTVSLLASTVDSLTGIAGSFSAIGGGSPNAALVTVVGEANAQFVMALNYFDTTQLPGLQSYPDGIWWSALGNYQSWTPSIATEAGNIRLLDSAGPITAAIPFRDGVLVFKPRSMYLGSYVGGAAVWAFERIAHDIGANFQAVCAVEDTVYFVDEQGIWYFDGSYPKPVPGAINKWLAKNMGTMVYLSYDKANHHLWVRYADDGNGGGLFVVYNTRSQTWTQHGTVGDPSTGNVNLLALPGYAVLGLSQTQAAQSLAGNIPAASLRLAAHGNTYGTVTCRGFRPQFTTGPSDTATGWVSGTLNYGASVRNIIAASASAPFAAPGRFDVLQTARFVSPRLDFPGGTAWEISKMAIDLAVNPIGE